MGRHVDKGEQEWEKVMVCLLCRIMASEEEALSTPTESDTNNQCNLMEGSIEDRAELMCQICDETLKEPKVLTCLHVYCRTCLETKVEEESEPVDEEPTKPLTCPVSQLL